MCIKSPSCSLIPEHTRAYPKIFRHTSLPQYLCKSPVTPVTFSYPAQLLLHTLSNQPYPAIPLYTPSYPFSTPDTRPFHLSHLLVIRPSTASYPFGSRRGPRILLFVIIILSSPSFLDQRPTQVVGINPSASSPHCHAFVRLWCGG